MGRQGVLVDAEGHARHSLTPPLRPSPHPHKPGINGVKVDCQAGVGLVGSRIGGGPTAAARVHQALEDSISTHFEVGGWVGGRPGAWGLEPWGCSAAHAQQSCKRAPPLERVHTPRAAPAHRPLPREQDNHAINCMCHSTENIYRWRDTAVARASDDFYPTDRASHIPHLAACAFNGLFLSPLALPGALRMGGRQACCGWRRRVPGRCGA